MASKDRVIALQRQLALARALLVKIATGHSRNPAHDAEQTLDELFRLDPKQPLQGLVGHAPRKAQ